MKNFLFLYYDKILIIINHFNLNIIALLRRQKLYIAGIFFTLISFFPLFGQINNSSPSNWIYLDGNSQATRRNSYASTPQDIDSIKLKWSTDLISGQVQPLIGNIANNPKINAKFPNAPNEITAVMGDKLILFSGTGKLLASFQFPDYVVGIKSVSALLDTLSTDFSGNNSLSIIATESIEHNVDSMANNYLFYYNENKQTIEIYKRLALDLRQFAPNIYSSLKSFAGKRTGDDFQIFTTANIHTPIFDSNNLVLPYLRGILKFNLSNTISTFPFNDIGDDITNRIAVAPEINLYQPSFIKDNLSRNLVLLPTYGNLNDSISINNDILSKTYNRPYLLGLNLSGNSAIPLFPIIDLSTIVSGNKTIIRPYFISLKDKSGNDTKYILVAENYSGLDSSIGTSRLHLFYITGNQLTKLNDTLVPPIIGGSNHIWSIAQGDVDGNPINKLLPYYPNNPGEEIIATMSSLDFAYPDNYLLVLRYQPDGNIAKPTPPNTYLHLFDTICTQKISGWVACVNDFDGDKSGKDEIFIVDGGTFRILRMRDYADDNFRLGHPFDTTYSHTFPNQTIFSLSIADLEGDGKNDIIVTTNDSTYIFGSNIPNSFAFLNPKIQQTPPEPFCIGKDIILQWVNYTLTEKTVKLEFQETYNNKPIDSIPPQFIGNIDNNKDTVFYTLFLDNSFYGKEGFFILTGLANPKENIDTSAIIRFNMPGFTITNGIDIVYQFGDEITIYGVAQCADSISLQISADSITWQELVGKKIENSSNIQLQAALPCLPIIDCARLDSIFNIHCRIISISGVSDTNYLSLRVIPKKLQISIDPCETDCPTLRFHWNKAFSSDTNSTIYFSYSMATINDAIAIGSAEFSRGEFIWDLPSNIGSTIRFYACDANDCARFDTTLRNIQPKYLSIVSPNPYNPNTGGLEVIYKIPVDAVVNIRVIDQANKVVAEITKDGNRKKDITYCDRWNGEKIGGGFPAIGMYYIVLDISDGSREIYPFFIRK
jgi:hypothetical protein